MIPSTAHCVLMELALAGAGRNGASAGEDLTRLLGAVEQAGFDWKGRASCGRPWLVLALAGWPEPTARRHRLMGEQTSFSVAGRDGHAGEHEPWERLAGMLLSQGADPFDGALDDSGALLPCHGATVPSGFHAAWRAQAHAVLATMLLHPSAPPPAVWERSLAPTGEPWLEAAAAHGLISWLEALLAHGVRPGPRALGVLGKQAPDITLQCLKLLWNAGARAYAADEEGMGLSAQWLLSFTHNPSDALAWLEKAGVCTEPALADWPHIAARGQHYLWGRWTRQWTPDQWLVPLRISATCQMPLAWWLALNALPGMVFSADGPASSVEPQWWNTLVPSLDVWPEDLQAFACNWPKENSATVRDARLTVPGWLALREVMRESRLPADVVLRVDETLEQALLELTHLVRTSGAPPPDAIAWWSAFLTLKTKSCVHRGLTGLAEALQELPASAHDELRSNQDVGVVVGLLTVISDANDSKRRFAADTPWLDALFSCPALSTSSDRWPDLLASLSGPRPDLAARVQAARLGGAWGDSSPATTTARF